jgi:hypothetical protein
LFNAKTGFSTVFSNAGFILRLRRNIGNLATFRGFPTIAAPCPFRTKGQEKRGQRGQKGDFSVE